MSWYKVEIQGKKTVIRNIKKITEVISGGKFIIITINVDAYMHMSYCCFNNVKMCYFSNKLQHMISYKWDHLLQIVKYFCKTDA